MDQYLAAKAEYEGLVLSYLELLAGNSSLTLGSLPGLASLTERGLLEYTMKQLLRRSLVPEANSNNDQFDLGSSDQLRFLEEGKRLVDLALLLCNKQQADVLPVLDDSFPLLLLEEFFDLLPAIMLESLFDYMVSRRQSLLKDMAPNKGKGLYTLRVCNNLLKRLSKSTHASLCGKVLVFLSSSFPLTERSAVNLRGTWNLDHPILLEPPAGELSGDQMDVDAGSNALPESVVDWASVSATLKDNPTYEMPGFSIQTILASLNNISDDEALPYVFYQAFWLFQDFCKGGIRPADDLEHSQVLVSIHSHKSADDDFLMDSASVTDTSTTKTTSLLKPKATAMQSSPLILTFWPLYAYLADKILILFEGLEIARANACGASKEFEFINPHFLASRKLLRFQLRDEKFHMRTLIQYAFSLSTLVEFMKSNVPQTEDTNCKLEHLVKFYNRTLNLMTKYRCIPQSVHSLLSEELFWLEWKKQSCPSYEKQFMPDEALKPLLNPRPKSSPEALNVDLSNAPPSLTKSEALRQLKEKAHMPSLDAYLQPLIEQLDPSSGIEKEYRLDNHPVYVWTAKRLILAQDYDNFKQDEPLNEYIYRKYPEVNGSNALESDENMILT